VRRCLAAALACAALAAAACGGGDDGGPETPKPAESIEEFRARLTTAVAAIEAGQCDTVTQFNAKAGFQLPCDEKTKKLFAGFTITAAKAYGTGGVVEFRDAEVKNGFGVYTIAIGEDGKYQLTGPISPIVEGPSTTQRAPKDPKGMDRAAEDMVESIRANDCNRFYESVITPEGLPKDQACRQELTEAYGPLRQQLTRHEDAKPERLDGNDQFMFYALRTGEQYRTLIVSRTAPGAPKPFFGFVTFRGPSEKPET
jgi:hypothetical protein